MSKIIAILISISLLSILLISSTANANPDEEWRKIFTDKSQDQIFNVVQQTSDGGYIIGASTRSYNSGGGSATIGNFDMMLIKTDSNGNQQWSKTYGNFDNDKLTTILQIKDGYLLLGKTDRIKSYDILLIKTDKSGNEQWSKIFGDIETDNPYFIQQTSDEGYILSGYIYSGDYFIKLDKDGNKQWQTEIKDDSQYLTKNLSGDYLIKEYLYTTDSNDNITWIKISGKDIIVANFKKTYEGGYIVVGGVINNKIIEDSIMIKIDENGNEQWNKKIGVDFIYDDATSVWQNIDRSFIVSTYKLNGGIIETGDSYVGYERYYRNGYINSLLVKIKSEGIVIKPIKTTTINETDENETNVGSVINNTVVSNETEKIFETSPKEVVEIQNVTTTESNKSVVKSEPGFEMSLVIVSIFIIILKNKYV